MNEDELKEELDFVQDEIASLTDGLDKLVALPAHVVPRSVLIAIDKEMRRLNRWRSDLLVKLTEVAS